MQFNSSAGWLFLVLIDQLTMKNQTRQKNKIDLMILKLELRLVLWTVLNMPLGSFVHMAPDCSSWGVPSRGTSWRTSLNVAGNILNGWVRDSNIQVSRPLSYDSMLIACMACICICDRGYRW